MNLPDDVLKIISNKLLRLILDDVEDSSELLSRGKMGYMDTFINIFIDKRPQYHESSNNIDFIIKLIRAKNIGADPNTKNYKGKTILYLLIKEFLITDYLGIEDSEYQLLLDKINLLHKYYSNSQIKNHEGNTIAHLLISNWVNENYSGSYEIDIIEFLQNLGMNINEVKNNEGYTAYGLGKVLIDFKYINYTKPVIIYHRMKLDELLLRELQIKFELLNKDIDKLESYNSIKIKTL